MTALEWIFKLIVIWLSIDLLIIATGWYLVTTIRPCFPGWWRRHIADETPWLI